MKSMERMKEEMDRAYQAHLIRERHNLAWFVNHMDVTSLVDWLAVAGRAGVPFIESKIAGWLDRSDLMLMWDEDEEARARTALAWDRIRERIRPGTVLRADYASAYAVKAACGASGRHGQCRWDEDEHQGLHEDMRIAELGHSWSRNAIPVHERPYVKPEMIEGYAVELRVWVRKGKVRAVSNYYPQRPLPDNDWVRARMDEAITQAQRLSECVPDDLVPDNRAPAPGETPWTEKTFSADFLVPEHTDEVFFLEGNPYTFASWGAHPCCLIERLEVLLDKERDGIEKVFASTEAKTNGA